ncbi:5-(carboxyamino)imidazole ribonucleotide synthase [Leeia sp. TBRC 13508]|uniref:N5-carboxyaminoimidazole ribonucleotide synthase n=1 Tax=Leeia speluncae TaxID=2884804 RepID=A0ABS8D6X7_9NEIS|nr:5-(carboxyamino)imidazole ribonucleotide synthase [Leeia speluncae]MCB6183393.1 5-(carboxyamino)imidazole ribonucleotide synthase [Leeia speluncae]
MSDRTPNTPILPPAMLGILGGGQLGCMFTVAAKTMGYQVTVLDPDPNAPAARFADEHLCAAFDDQAALEKMAANCAAITTEFENVNANSMKWLAQSTFVSPRGECVEIAQDRIREKTFFRDAGLPTAPFLAIEKASDLEVDLSLYLPGILKTARMGYDGKGQVRVKTKEELLTAWQQLKETACVLEKMMPLKTEVSAIVTRSVSGDCAVFPVSENHHFEGILDVSIVPANVTDAVKTSAAAAAKTVASSLGYVGVLAIEFFVLADDSLVVNEMAPRPHNSGHYTLDATTVSQFQQQVRAMCGLPPGDATLLKPVAMVNLLGDVWPGAGTADCKEPDWSSMMSEPSGFLHLYGKKEARVARKMGHYNLLGSNANDVAAKVAALRDELLTAAGRPRPLA